MLPAQAATFGDEAGEDVFRNPMLNCGGRNKNPGVLQSVNGDVAQNTLPLSGLEVSSGLLFRSQANILEEVRRIYGGFELVLICTASKCSPNASLFLTRLKL